MYKLISNNPANEKRLKRNGAFKQVVIDSQIYSAIALTSTSTATAPYTQHSPAWKTMKLRSQPGYQGYSSNVAPDSRPRN